MSTELIVPESGETFPLSPDDHVSRLIILLEYARRRGFRIGPTVQVGDVTLAVRDLRQDDRSERDGSDPAPGIWEQAGFEDRK
ncbi:MAG: hypothetical protein ACTHU0_19185 [Kofleriaceae bacterium]